MNLSPEQIIEALAARAEREGRDPVEFLEEQIAAAIAAVKRDACALTLSLAEADTRPGAEFAA